MSVSPGALPSYARVFSLRYQPELPLGVNQRLGWVPTKVPVSCDTGL